MKYSKEEVKQYVVEEDVKFIRLAFCDVFGRQKNISINGSFSHGGGHHDGLRKKSGIFRG